MDPFSQELWLRESGVQRDNICRDVGVSKTPARTSATAGTAWTGTARVGKTTYTHLQTGLLYGAIQFQDDAG